MIFEIHQAKLSNLLCVSVAARAEAPGSKISYFCWSWVRIPLQTEKITIIFFPSLFFFLFLLNCVSHTLRGHSQAMWTSKGEGKYFKFHLCINQLVVRNDSLQKVMDFIHNTEKYFMINLHVNRFRYR